jgi:hypothetical protein
MLSSTIDIIATRGGRHTRVEALAAHESLQKMGLLSRFIDNPWTLGFTNQTIVQREAQILRVHRPKGAYPRTHVDLQA